MYWPIESRVRRRRWRKAQCAYLSSVHGVVPTRRLQLSSWRLRMVGRRGLHWPDHGRSERARWRRRRRRRQRARALAKCTRRWTGGCGGGGDPIAAGRENGKNRNCGPKRDVITARMTREPVTGPRWWWWDLDGGRGVRLARNVIVVIIMMMMIVPRSERINII